MDLGLNGKVILVTGGARGIGWGICQVLAEEGANLVVNYRSDPDFCEPRIKQLSQEQNVETMAYQADIGFEDQVEAMFKAGLKQFGEIHCVVNNAGAMGRRKFEEMDIDEWMRFENTNVNGMMFVSRAFIQHRLAVGGSGRAVNVLSKSAVSTNSTNNVAYCTTKAAGIGFTRGLTNEMMARGIVFNAILPGYVTTERNSYTRGTDEANRKKALIPTGTYSTPREMGDVTAYLLSERSSSLAGVILDVTGGLLL